MRWPLNCIAPSPMSTHPDTQAVLTYTSTLKRARVVSLGRTAEVTRLPKHRIMAAFRDLQKRGEGHLVIGRKGHPTRFVLKYAAVEAAPPPPSSGNVEAHIPLRDGAASVFVSLPEDLTSDEALDIADTFMTLSDSLRAKIAGTVARLSAKGYRGGDGYEPRTASPLPSGAPRVLNRSSAR